MSLIADRSLEFFNIVRRQFSEALLQTPGVEHAVEIAGLKVRLLFAGAALESVVMPALAHLRAPDPEGSDVTIGLFDDASTGTRMPPPPWTHPHALYPGRREAYTWRGEVAGYNSDRIATSFNYTACALSMLDGEERHALYWTVSAATLPEWERASPLRTILSWLFGRPGRQLVHAAAVGTAAGGVLIAGKGGSGKSTSALACLPSELGYLGDDYCLVELDPTPVVHALYNSARVVHDNLHRLPHVRAALAGGQQKALLFLYPTWPEKLVCQVPLRAILVPRLASATALTAAEPRDGLHALAVSTMAQLPRAGAATLRTLERLVQQVPVYILELGPQVSDVPAVIREVLASPRSLSQNSLPPGETQAPSTGRTPRTRSGGEG